MKTKIFIVLIFILLSFLTNSLVAQNWVPLEIGNEWQYIQIEHSYSLPNPDDTTGFSVELIYNKILRDTVFNNHTYFNHSLAPDLWYRYSSSEQKLFLWWENTDELIMDFSLTADSLFNTYLIGQGEVLAVVIEGDQFLFDSTFQYKGFEWFLVGDFSEKNKFVDNYGLADYYYDWVDNAMMFRYQKYMNLIQANISMNNLSSDVYPEIYFNPITILSDSNFNLSITVDHPYNVLIRDPGYPYSGLNFIDSVCLYSFYSKEDSVINNSPLNVENIPNSDTWIINTTLNLGLMSKSFVFNYKIEAIDKGLMPHRSFAPDSGYFLAVYDTTSNISGNYTLPESFTLSQNYPNPFNPSTKIRYEIPERSFVTIKIFDVLSNEIATIVNEEKTAGSYEVEFNASSGIRNLVSGIYFYQLKVDELVQTKKMILLK